MKFVRHAWLPRALDRLGLRLADKYLVELWVHGTFGQSSFLHPSHVVRSLSAQKTGLLKELE